VFLRIGLYPVSFLLRQLLPTRKQMDAAVYQPPGGLPVLSR
jgi:hypothetical protein